MSSILSNTDVPNNTFNAFHSFDGFDILDIELPQTFAQANFGNNAQLDSEHTEQLNEKLASVDVVYSVEDDDADDSEENYNQESSSAMFGKGKSIIEFFYTEEKEIIDLDSPIFTFDDYEIF